jgi:hypothetical protein
VLQLYNYVLPFFKSLEFRSRKLIDFQLWELAVKLKALGFTTQSEGKTFLIPGLIKLWLRKEGVASIHKMVRGA